MFSYFDRSTIPPRNFHNAKTRVAARRRCGLKFVGLGVTTKNRSRKEQYFKIGYPVGYATTEQVDGYMGRGAKEVLNIPQIVVIDRAGMIRAQNGSKYDTALENESSLRELLGRLLKESAPRSAKKMGD